MLLKIFRVHTENFEAIGWKLHGGDKNNNDSDNDSYAQGWATKCLLFGF